MSIYKNRLKRKFTTLPNEIIEAPISHAAFRIYCYLISKPDGWTVLNDDIKKKLRIKDKESLAKYWKELIQTGWISRMRSVDQQGKFIGGYDYQLNEEAFIAYSDENLVPEKPAYEKTPQSENMRIQYTNTDSYTKTNNIINNTNNDFGRINFNFDGFLELEIDAINLWFDYKNERKEYYTTKTGLTSLRNKLLKIKNDRGNIPDRIEDSMSNNWTGIFPAKININSQSKMPQWQQKEYQEAQHAKDAKIATDEEVAKVKRYFIEPDLI